MKAKVAKAAATVTACGSEGRRYEQKLSDNGAPEEMALRLAKIINRKLAGDGAGFNRPIKYSAKVFV